MDGPGGHFAALGTLVSPHAAATACSDPGSTDGSYNNTIVSLASSTRADPWGLGSRHATAGTERQLAGAAAKLSGETYMKE